VEQSVVRLKDISSAPLKTSDFTSQDAGTCRMDSIPNAALPFTCCLRVHAFAYSDIAIPQHLYNTYSPPDAVSPIQPSSPPNIPSAPSPPDLQPPIPKPTPSTLLNWWKATPKNPGQHPHLPRNFPILPSRPRIRFLLINSSFLAPCRHVTCNPQPKQPMHP
jgi:hypothetical protein